MTTGIAMDIDRTRRLIEQAWRGDILPALREYITIPNQSPAYDPHWYDNGHMDHAVELVAGWIRSQAIPGLTLDVVQMAGRTPLLCVEVPGDSPETVLLYGHLDKQPPMDGWHEGLGPWQPVIRDGKLYGRGGADDGYAAFAAITAIRALKIQGLPCARCLIVIEACEESGSGDLPAYIDALQDRIGTPSLVVCLDSGCGNYEQLWITTSLRGLITGNLTVSTLTEGVHSGGASGIVPSTFRIARQLLSRLEDERTGAIIPRNFYVDVPPERLTQAAATAQALGASVYATYPFRGHTAPVSHDLTELLLNRTWRPQLEITGADGLPALDKSGNVLRPVTTLKVSLRLPPTADAATATRALQQLLEADPPYGASVRFEAEQSASGWNAPPLEPWLEDAAAQASQHFFGHPARYMGEGGTIPFMAMLGAKFPAAQFVITGVLGPQSNAHGPNEFLHLAAATRLTACVASILGAHMRA
jgi:acetylornithine deacetylase/succinyl-diaminopimelate desuccinylase-like protein